MKGKLVAAIVMTLVVSACGADLADEATTAAPATEAPGASPSTSLPSGFDQAPVDDDDVGDVTREPDPDDPMEGSLLDRALADLALELDAQVADIRVVYAEEVTWRDGSLGCPEPGMAYTQALVPGWRALLEVDGMQYAYHAAADGDPFLCENPQEPLPGDPGDA